MKAHARPQDEPTAAGDPSDDPRMVEAVEKYMAELEAGRPVDVEEFVESYSAIAPALRECLQGLKLMVEAAPHLQNARPFHEVEGCDKKSLGDYLLKKEIGRGGMGIVYEAEQMSLGRRVAVKVLPFAAALDAKQLRRFKNEALAAAHLQHPHIVPVFAVGCERGVHFYAMQLVDGQSLAALLQSLRPQQEIPRSAPHSATTSPYLHNTDQEPSEFGDTCAAVATLVEERSQTRSTYFRHIAELGKTAAEALEHAHQMGVIHRDIKPANLLLDDEGKVWVTDFGLALLPSTANVTVTGELVGTLRYMSPEQALAKHGLMDHRTDIYSLGVTLYELLSLEPAFPQTDRAELLQALAQEDPILPRVHDKSIPRELETIILKAMAKHAGDRYATAQDLADDLQRFLTDEPIQARRPGLWEKTVKWSRRHKAVVMGVFVGLMLALAGLGVTTILVAQAYDREKEKGQEVQKQFDRAEAYFRQAKKSVDFFAQFSEEELAHDPSLQSVRRRLLETALDYYQEFLEQSHDNPAVQAELAASQAKVSGILRELSILHSPSLLSILLDRHVQEDLQLSQEQREQLKELATKFSDQWGRGFWAFRKTVPDPEERRAKALESTKATEKAILSLFTEEQHRRFKQIALQIKQQNRHGFSDPELVEALKLTTGQREKIRKIQYEADASSGGMGMFKKPGTKPVSWVEVNEKIMSTFNTKQREAWSVMTGVPIKVELRPEFPQGPPRFGPPGRFEVKKPPER